MPKTVTKRPQRFESLPIRKRMRAASPSHPFLQSSEKKLKLLTATPTTEVEGPTKSKLKTQHEQQSQSSFMLSKSAHAILTTDLDVINKLNYRNKNQHRVSKWWKWFDLLRRHLRKFLAAYDVKSFNEAEARAGYLKNWVVPGAYVSFSRGLVAAKSWAGLGIVLLGILARVHGALASKEEIQSLIAETIRMNRSADSEIETPQIAMDDVGETLERSMEDVDEEVDTDDFTMHEDPVMDETSAIEDVAPYKEEPLFTETTETVELVTREIEMADETPNEPASKPKRNKSKRLDKGDDDGLKKKKKKKKGKLDDLFAGLI